MSRDKISEIAESRDNVGLVIGSRPCGSAEQHSDRCSWHPVLAAIPVRDAYHGTMTQLVVALRDKDVFSMMLPCCVQTLRRCRACLWCSSRTSLVPADKPTPFLLARPIFFLLCSLFFCLHKPGRRVWIQSPTPSLYDVDNWRLKRRAS